MEPDFLKDLDFKTRPLLESLRQELSGIRANRPTPQLVEDILVDYGGQMLKVKQLGSIGVTPPRELQISVWDKSVVQGVAKAIENSSLKLNPSVEGNVVHLRLPPLTEERREELTKIVKAAAEKIRIKLRNLRDETNKKIEESFKAKTINEDQKFKGKKRVQEAVDKTNKDIDALLNSKIAEINA